MNGHHFHCLLLMILQLSGHPAEGKQNGCTSLIRAVLVGAAPRMEARRMQVERILREYGQFLRPMAEAPRDGRRILAHARHGHLVACFWESRPARLIGPNWMEEKDSQGGYLDRYFDGWISLADFRILDGMAINRLLVAYIDDARAAENFEALKVLEPS